jgi:hypothetical protein
MSRHRLLKRAKNISALTVNRTRGLQIFSLTLSQLSYQGTLMTIDNILPYPLLICLLLVCDFVRLGNRTSVTTPTSTKKLMM